ncbi:MAG TPA: hypothetical protein VKA32_06230 [Gammaproteobacteria bacterium]|nr:hypothetical protein [Gammaproteobacteria bacterium]
MATLQGLRQQSVRDVTGTAHTYSGDWHALFDAHSIGGRTFNERLLNWINAKLSADHDNINAAMQAFAADQGVADWDSMGTFDASAP